MQTESYRESDTSWAEDTRMKTDNYVNSYRSGYDNIIWTLIYGHETYSGCILIDRPKICDFIKFRRPNNHGAARATWTLEQRDRPSKSNYTGHLTKVNTYKPLGKDLAETFCFGCIAMSSILLIYFWTSFPVICCTLFARSSVFSH